MNKLLLSTCLVLAFMGNGLAQGKKTDIGSLGNRTFVYGQDVHLAHPIAIDSTDSRPLNEILDQELDSTGISYRITKNHILLFAPKQETTKARHTLYGYVIDQDSKESLIGANIYTPLYNYGTSTNVFGHFSITLPEGEALVETSYVGYKTDSRIINLSQDTLITITLKAERELAEVTIESDRPETGTTSSHLGATTIPVKQIFQTPALFGEADVIKTLQLQPGVQSGMSGQVSMSVRGGDTDQNLFLLDGMPLYNIDHVMGFESAFMPDAVKHVDFFRGSFAARYGGRLSSVTDVRTKDGDMRNYHGNFSIGLLSSHLSVEGPIVKDRTSFIVSARRSYADWLLNTLKKPLGLSVDRLDLYFYDLNAKINHKFSDNDRIYLSFYRGQDVTGVTDKDNDEYNGLRRARRTSLDVGWGNTLYQLRWNHIFSPQLFANLTAGYNRFGLHYAGSDENKDYLNNILRSSEAFEQRFSSGINDLMTSIDLDYHPLHNHHFRIGAQYTRHEFRPEIQTGKLQNYVAGSSDLKEVFSSQNQKIWGHESALYFEDDINLGERWQVNAGLRTVLFSTDGKNFPSLEPRLSASYLVKEGVRAKAAYSVMHQYVHKLMTSQIAAPSDFWVPVTKDMRPMSAQQVSAGIFYNKLKGWEFGIEAYWKDMHNVVDFKDGTSFLGSTKGWESKISTGKARAYGIEFSASKTQGRTTGMFSYTLGKSDRWYPDGSINGGRKFPFRYDRRHVFHFLVQHQLTKHIDINASWNFASGSLVSVAKQQTVYIEPTKTYSGAYYSGRNNYRMGPTHQLDFSINFHKPTKHGESIWNFSLMNVYCHLNQDFVYSVVETNNNSSSIVSAQVPNAKPSSHRETYQVTVIPILPSFSYTYKF